MVFAKKMKRWLLAVMLLLSLPLGIAQASPDTFPADQIKPGMHGIAKTVVSGDRIEEFGVEFLGVMKKMGPAGDLLLIHVYGPVIDRTGGIVQGMSGSPVYINGRLVGAIAYGKAFSDQTYGMVTPIGDMLKIWNLPDRKNTVVEPKIHFAALDEPVKTEQKKDGPKQAEGRDKQSAKPPEKTAEKAGGAAAEAPSPAQPARAAAERPAGAALYGASTPLMAAGFSDAALSMLTEQLKPFQMTPYAVGGADDNAPAEPLKPGSAVGMALIRGDISLGAMGTVTYVEGDKVLAFGHPAFRRGNVSYFMTNAEVLASIKGLDSGFKAGSLGPAIGIINQDRNAGVSGVIGRFPSVVPVRVRVFDQETQQKETYYFQVVNDEELAPALTTTGVFNAIDKTADRLGPGSARVGFEITARGMPGGVLKRENMFSGMNNVSQSAVAEFMQAMNLLSMNSFNPVDIIQVNVDVALTPERRTASIVEAKPDKASAKPGDTVRFAVKLKPYRGQETTKTVSFVIPKDQPEGPLMLDVRGGGLISVAQLIMQQQGIDVNAVQNRGKSFAAVLKDFVESPRNNEILIEQAAAMPGEELMPNQAVVGAPPAKPGGGKPAPKPAVGADAEAKAKPMGRALTDYVIDNMVQATIHVEKASSDKTAAEGAGEGRR